MSVSPSPNPSPSAPGGLTALTHPLIHAGPQPACVPSSPWSDSSRSQLSISWLSHPGLGLEVVRGLPCAQRQEGPVSPQGTRILLLSPFPLPSSPWALIPYHHHPLGVPSSTRARPLVGVLTPPHLCGHEGTLLNQHTFRDSLCLPVIFCHQSPSHSLFTSWHPTECCGPTSSCPFSSRQQGGVGG